VTLALWTGIVVSLASRAACQLPDPQPTGSHWLVAGPEEVVGWFTFDPAGVTSRLPEYLRFVTVGELASSGIRWAVDYLAHHKAHAEWGVSFLEIVRADTFAIDGRQPNWPQRGAAAVWFARVLPKPGTPDLGPGLPLLMLEFWIPDSAYVTFMQQRGHYSTYADVRLAGTATGGKARSTDRTSQFESDAHPARQCPAVPTPADLKYSSRREDPA